MTYLTKTRFKEAIVCPDKLFFYRKLEYADNRMVNEFLQELAKCGIQVGELAKSYYPDGVEVLEMDSELAIKRTEELLKADKCILFEAALSVDDLLSRVDILVKDGREIEIIEVKSKSFSREQELYTQSGSVIAGWREYVYDIAFQVFVARKIFKDCNVKGFLYLIDKNSVCTVDGLYQRFRLKKEGDRYIVQSNAEMPLGDPILKKVDLTEVIEKIIEGRERINGEDISFSDFVKVLSKALKDNSLINSPTGRWCKNCAYKATVEDKLKGLKSGYEECWKSKHDFKDSDFQLQSVFEIWNLHHTKLDQFLGEKKFFSSNITRDELEPRSQSKSERKLSNADRQWIQIQVANDKASSPYVNKDGLRKEFENLKFPLHFIDFEVAMNAIPFLKGLSPYHRLAFQFSHHVLEKDGRVVHRHQWIESRRYTYPNFSFVRELKKDLSESEGSVLIYSAYENTILLHLMDVLMESKEKDKDELVGFIKTLTWHEDNDEKWSGPRKMIDMREWILDFYLSKHMKQSNSLKAVLPAILNDSSFLKDKYQKADYGTELMPSLNFKNHQWVSLEENGLVINPYNTLPPVFDGLDREAIELLFEEDDLADGGAAMGAFNLMQFMEMSEEERISIVNALYKYCELDTLAMVMLFEGLSDLIRE